MKHPSLRYYPADPSDVMQSMQSNRLHPVTSLAISSAPLFDISCSPPPPNQVNRITSPASLPSPLRSPFKANLKLDDLHTRVEGGLSIAVHRMLFFLMQNPIISHARYVSATPSQHHCPGLNSHWRTVRTVWGRVALQPTSLSSGQR